MLEVLPVVAHFFTEGVYMIPKSNEIYKHFKGNLYRIITIAIHSETEEQMVVYQGMYGDFPIYCRPLSMFVSEVDHEKYPDVTQKYRFERLDNPLNTDMSVIPLRDAELKGVAGNNAQEEMTEEEPDIDPLILEFLDAETVLDKKNILAALHHRITDDMINTLAVAMDVVIEEGDTEERYRQLKTCLDTIERYEIERK